MISVKTYRPEPYDRKEILRYAGVRGSLSGTLAAQPPELSEIWTLLESCLKELSGKLHYRVCCSEFAIAHEGGELDLGFARTASADLKKNLKNCESIVLFGATVGIELDRLITKYSRVAPSRALLFQAIGAERIESLCDVFCQEIREQKAALGQFVMPRFSPGYGDLPLSFQTEIFRVLACPKHIGLTLNSSLLMSPTKSVTAIVGVGRKD